MGNSFSQSTFKTKLKMLPHRCTYHITKLNNEIKSIKRAIVNHLKNGEEETARFSAENVMLLERRVLALQFVGLNVQYVNQHQNDIIRQPSCPQELLEPLSNIVLLGLEYSVISEASDLVKQLGAKYGAEWIHQCKSRASPRLLEYLSIPKPTYNELVDYLAFLAKDAG